MPYAWLDEVADPGDPGPPSDVALVAPVPSEKYPSPSSASSARSASGSEDGFEKISSSSCAGLSSSSSAEEEDEEGAWCEEVEEADLELNSIAFIDAMRPPAGAAEGVRRESSPERAAVDMLEG